MNKGYKIGLLGGSFNPPHKGHLQISNFAIKKFSLQKLLWVVVPQNPFKTGLDLLPIESRVKLCKTLTQNEKKISITDFEKNLPSCQTYFTIKKLKQLFPKATLFWIMGFDNFFHFHTWKGADYIMNNVNIVAFPRGSWHKAVRTKYFIKYKSKIHILNHPKIPISSTKIRADHGLNWKNFF